jgi:hypothetical protein
MPITRSPKLLGCLPSLLLFVIFCVPVQAQRNGILGDRQALEAAEQTMNMPSLGFGDEPPKAQRRKDLENLLVSVDPKIPVENVYFYDQPPPSTAFNGSSFPLVAVSRSTREVYKLRGFDASPGPNESLLEFNRLISALRLSIAKDRAVRFAALFLGSSVSDGPGEISLDDDGVPLRLAVQNYYFAAYGDVWRALEAYARWWQEFRSTTPELSPVVTLDVNGGYRVILKRLVMPAGGQPEVKNWELEISRDGQVRVLSMQMIFPAHPGWLFFDLR